MKGKYSSGTRINKSILLLLFIFIVQSMIINCQVAEATIINEQITEPTKIHIIEKLYNEQIARGIIFQQNKNKDYQELTVKNNNEFIITADLNDPMVNIISGKAQDKVLKLETLSGQIAREQLKGQNVVAGINGDMFNISAGTMDYGSPQGLQVKDGKILLGFDTVWAEPRFPVFAITKDRQAIIKYLSLDARLFVVEKSYETKHGSANSHPDLTISIDTINRNNPAVMSNRMILLTPQLSDSPIVGFTDEQAVNGTLTVLKNISACADGSIQLGREYEAEIASVGDTSTGLKSIAIPPEGMVLASHGIKATWVKEHLQKGDKIRFSFNLKDQEGNILDLEQAVTAWLPLIENGQALTQKEMLEKARNDWDGGTAVIKAADKSRAAIGYTADNRVIALAIDGGGEAQDSFGIDLPGMAARMRELGAVAAVSLDGGGSTQMNSRLFGETDVQLINKPSDGRERPISNTILFSSNAPKTFDINALKVNKDIIIYKNTDHAFQLRGQDSNGNPADLSEAEIKWSIKPQNNASDTELSGSIDNHGLFKAGGIPASQYVSASIGSVEGLARVRVVDSVHSLTLTDNGTIAIGSNSRKQFQIAAYTEDGQAIIIPNSAVQWSVSPAKIASIDNNGLLLSSREKGNATVKAKVGDKEVSINIVVGLNAQLIDSFEFSDPDSYYINGYLGGNCQISTEQVKHGNYSLRVDYDYASWAKIYNGTINVIMDKDKRTDNYTSTIRPRKLGMWVYGNGQAPWLRATIRDGNNNARTLNLASSINWVGWKYIEADIPPDIPMPVSLDYFYMVEIDKNKDLKGTVYFDEIRFVYSDNQ